jgi:hypothetical protein
MKQREYALYKGDTFLTIGTAREIAKQLGINVKSVLFYGTPTYTKRTKGENKMVLLLLDDEEEDANASQCRES